MTDTLYNLLPLIYREEDYRQGQPLRALMGVLQDAHDTVSDDIMQMYQNWFIETCEEARIPYIGDLVGLTGLHETDLLSSERRYVANFIAYARRNGMAATLENIVYDSSSFACYGVCETRQLAMSWTARDPALTAQTFSSHPQACSFAGAPFDKVAKTADFHNNRQSLLNTESGVIHPATVSVYLWRSQAMPMVKAALTPLPEHPERLCISPFAMPVQLYNQPHHLDVREVSAIEHYPVALTRANSAYFMADAREDGYPAPVVFFARSADGHYSRLAEDSLLVSDLSQWKNVRDSTVRLVYDPECGRVLVKDKTLIGNLAVSYSYMGHDVYGAHPVYRGVGVSVDARIRITASHDVASALKQVIANREPQQAMVSFAGNMLVALGDDALVIDLAGHDLQLVAEDYTRPVLCGDIIVTNSGDQPASIGLKGLVVHGSITLHDNVIFSGEHCTLVYPEGVAIHVRQYHSRHSPHVRITLHHSLLATAHLPEHAELCAQDSVLIVREDITTLASLCLLRSTLLGSVACNLATDIQDSLIAGTLTVHRATGSQFRHSYIATVKADGTIMQDGLLTDGTSSCKVLFRSKRYYDADLAMLAEGTDKRIMTGASNGEELGVFNSVRFRLKEQKITTRLKDFLPVGLEVQTIYMD